MARRRSSPVRQQEIAEAVIEIIARDGLPALSMPAVAARVGVVPSALYRHFAGKDQMIEAAVLQLRQRIGGLIDTATAEGGGALAVCRRLVDGFKALMPQPTAIPQIVFGLPGQRSRRMRRVVGELVDETIGRFAAVLEAGQRNGELRHGFDPPVVATYLWGMFVSTALRWHLASGKFDMNAHLDCAWKLLRDAIAVVGNPGGEPGP